MKILVQKVLLHCYKHINRTVKTQDHDIMSGIDFTITLWVSANETRAAVGIDYGNRIIGS
jgi:hypothetical protein